MTPMKSQKGQILSLDLLIALTAIIFALGLVLQAYELTAYDVKEASVWDEMVLTGQIAGERLMTDPQAGCDLTGDDFYITNCLRETTTPLISKEDLGIPGKYACLVDGFTVSGCSDTIPAGVKNVYSIKRKALVGPAGLSKQQLYDCIYGLNSCTAFEKEITLSLWRDGA